MKLKSIKRELFQLNDFIEKCGHFTIEGDHDYGCTIDNDLKQEPGKCYGFDCPFVFEADLEHFKELDQRLYDEYANGGIDAADGSGWVVRYCEEIK